MKKSDEGIITSVPKHLWACEKVKRYSAPTREKCVLYFIAYYANPLGYGAFPSYDQLHWDTGLPVRTIRRHIRALVMRGDLVSWCDIGWRGRSNNFFIPAAAESIQELEARTGIGRDQLRLPLVMTDKQPYIVGENGSIIPVNMKYPGPQWPTPTATVALPQGHGGPVTTSNNNVIKPEVGFTLKTKKERRMEKQRQAEIERLEREAREGERSERVSPDTHALIADTLERLRMQADAPAGFGHAMRRNIWGDTPEAEVQAARSAARLAELKQTATAD